MSYNIFIDNNKYLVKDAKIKTILQLCNSLGFDIPKFCYHEQLSIAGNCRMCLVSIGTSKKPVVSCAMPLSDNMEIYTNTRLVKKAREGILEFLLINHPLDCPICDQGGECDLQDQALIYGNNVGRFFESKRSIKDKICSGVVKTIMTRCIHCTRCIRFIDEFIGGKYFGLIGRGKNIEISNYISKNINSEISGNLIDLCPVGALTSKPYSFLSRPWELISWNTIDINDVLHLNIRVDVRDTSILKILPVFNSIINEVWISDISRFSYDSIKLNRILNPFKKIKSNKFISYSWEKIMSFFIKNLSNYQLNFILGDFLDCETGILLKNSVNLINNCTIFNDNILLSNNHRNSYILDYNIYKNLSQFKNIIIIGFNLRLFFPILNMKLKQLCDLNLIKLFNITSGHNINYNGKNFSNSIIELKNFISGKSFLTNIVLKSNRSLLLLNANNKNINLMFNLLNICINNFNLQEKLKFGMLNFSSTDIIINELNLIHLVNKFNDFSYTTKNLEYGINPRVLYCLNCYNKSILDSNNNNLIKIFQGSLLPDNPILFDILLPTVNHYEKNSYYINIFGYCQSSKFILFPPKYARNDWKILYIIFKNVIQIKINYVLINLHQVLKTYNIINNTVLLPVYFNNFGWKQYINIKNCFFMQYITNIYCFNKFIESSKILRDCYYIDKHIYNNFI